MSELSADDAERKNIKPLRLEAVATLDKVQKPTTGQKEGTTLKSSEILNSPAVLKDATPEENPELEEVNPYDDEEEHILKDNPHIAEFANTKVEVTLGDPVLRTGGAFTKNYVDYSISGSDKDGKFVANRRYKEFELLRLKLEELYPMFFIPGLPEKKVVNNTTPEFVKERQRGLEHFIFRLSRLKHLWYSSEVQHFIRSKDKFTSFMNDVKKPSYQVMYERNQTLFSDCDKEPSQEQLDMALRQFPMVKHWAQSFTGFRDNSKQMLEGIKKERFLRCKMISFATRDYTQKLSQSIAIQKVQDKVAHFKNLMGVPPTQQVTNPSSKLRKASKNDEKEKSDHLESNFLEDSKQMAAATTKPGTILDVEAVWSSLYTRLSGIQSDLSLFCELEEQFNLNKKEIEDLKTKRINLAKDADKLKSQNVAEVREGLFKFKTKEEKLKCMDREEKELQAEIVAAEKNYSLMASALIKYQLPLLLHLKNTEVKSSLRSLAQQRIEQTNAELELLRELQAHYKLY